MSQRLHNNMRSLFQCWFWSLLSCCTRSCTLDSTDALPQDMNWSLLNEWMNERWSFSCAENLSWGVKFKWFRGWDLIYYGESREKIDGNLRGKRVSATTIRGQRQDWWSQSLPLTDDNETQEWRSTRLMRVESDGCCLWKVKIVVLRWRGRRRGGFLFSGCLIPSASPPSILLHWERSLSILSSSLLLLLFKIVPFLGGNSPLFLNNWWIFYSINS